MPYIQKSFTYEGKRYFVKGKTEKEVSRKLEEKKRTIKANLKSIKYKDWYKEFLNVYKANVGTETRYTYECIGRRWLAPIHDKYLSEITPRDCQNIANSLTGCNKGFINITLNLLKTSLDKAVSEEYLEVSPMREIPSVKGTDGHRRALTKQEREVLEPILLQEGKANLFCAIVYFCGLRPSEVLGIKGKHIRGNNLIVEGTKTQNAKRVVPIPDVLCLPFKDDEEYLFTDKKGCKAPRCYERMYWDRIRNISKVNVTLYCLRHDYCTRLQEAKVPIDVARRLMGHSSIQLTSKIYTHENEESFEDARNLINQYEEKVKNKNR